MNLHVAVSLALLLAACLAPDVSNSVCKAPDCPVNEAPPLPDGPPPPRGDLDLPDELYPNFQFRRCEALAGVVTVPASALEAALPSAFVPVGLLPGTASVTVHFDSCVESLDHENLWGATHAYIVLAWVRPANEMWADSGVPTFYVLDAASDNSGLMHTMRRAYLEVRQSSIEMNKQTLPQDAFLAELTANGEGWSTSLHHMFLPLVEPQKLGHTIHLWYGDGPFHRITETTEYLGQDLSPGGVLVHTGDSGLAGLADPLTVYEGIWWHEKGTNMQYDGAWTEE